MTKDDLKDLKIIDEDEKLGDLELGILLLKYNKKLSNDPEKTEMLEEKIKEDLFSGRKFTEKSFLLNCLAICDPKIQKAYLLSSKDNLKTLFNVHSIVVAPKEVKNILKESIFEARKDDEAGYKLQLLFSDKYKEDKENIEVVLPLLTDDKVFGDYCKNFGITNKAGVKATISERFKNLFAVQERRLEKFTNYYVNTDSRILSYSNTEAAQNA